MAVYGAGCGGFSCGEGLILCSLDGESVGAKEVWLQKVGLGGS